jgi:hypothetical protein
MPVCEDEGLTALGEEIPQILTQAIAINTFRGYAQGWRQWRNWSDEFPETGGLPVRSGHLCLYFVSVLQSHAPFGRIEKVFNGLNWLHKMLGLENPCDVETVRTVREAAKRRLSKPIERKLPITPHVLERMAVRLRTSDILQLRTLTIALVSYAGFLRYDDLAGIRRSDIKFTSICVKLFIADSKTDQHNEGETVIIARTGKATCPYEVLSDYLIMAKIEPDDGRYIFRAVTRTRTGATLRQKDKAISYTTVSLGRPPFLADIPVCRYWRTVSAIFGGPYLNW